MFLLGTQKEPKRCPLLPIAREARLKGAWVRALRERFASAPLRIQDRTDWPLPGANTLHEDRYEISILYCLFSFGCRGRRCGVAQRSMPQWGIEPHERASFAGWRRSLCAAKRRRPDDYAYVAGGYGIRPYGIHESWGIRRAPASGARAAKTAVG